MTVVAVTIAVEMGENPLLFALAAKVAANGFTITPLAPAGVLTMSLSETAGYTDIIIPVMLNVMLWAVIMMVGFSIHYKIYRIKPGAVAVGGAVSEKNRSPGISGLPLSACASWYTSSCSAAWTWASPPSL